MLVSSFHPSPEDDLVAKGYLGDLLLICKNNLIPRDETRAKLLLSELSHLDQQNVTCPHIQQLLGVYYQDCCDQIDEAIPMFQKASNQNHAMSTSTIGYFCDYGIGVKKNSTKAFALYQQAANQGYPVAQCNVGKCYDSGSGCGENPILAAEWFSKSAIQGYVDAQFNMGVFCQIGRGVSADYSMAANWFQLGR
jgi:TPR repeat protein